jgi:RNA polymerase sporulation-specific sigma factor
MGFEASLVKAAHEGDMQARNTLVEENLGLVWSIVKRFYGRGYEPEDLFQVGSVGLIKAIDKFDISLGLQFSTYAVPVITGEIKRFLRDDGMVKVSRSLKENGWKLHQAREQLSKTLGRDATLGELAAATALSQEEIFMAMEANAEVESLHQTVYQSDGGGVALEERIADQHNEQEQLLDHMLVEELLAALPEQEQQLIRMRYFEEHTQSEVAQDLGISQVQVSRMEKKILMRMRRLGQS